MFIALQTPVPVGGLQALWFLLVAVLWIGFFVLEGFDFGTGMLYQVLSRKDPEERRVMVNSIGPMWDANQVWLLTAGGATFAAFPGWYATLFSGLYLPLFLVLVALIIRGISFEYRALNPSTQWKNTFDWLNSIGSFIVMLVLGVGFANFVRGLPTYASAANGMNPNLIAGDFAHRFFGLFMPFCLLGGVMMVVIALAHGSMWLSLKTSGAVLDKAKAFAPKAAYVATALIAVYVVWGNLMYATDNPFLNGFGTILRWVFGVVAILGMAAAAYFVGQSRYGISFIASAVSIAMLTACSFTAIFGTLGFVGDGQPYAAVNIASASSSHLTLVLMTVFACILVPIVLLYTIWAYTRFTRRLAVTNLPSEHGASKVGALA